MAEIGIPAPSPAKNTRLPFPAPDSAQGISQPEPHARLIVMPVLGMTCSACQHHVEAALTAVPGVLSAHVDLMRHRASIDFDASRTEPAALVEAVRGSGYEAVLPHPAQSSAPNPRDARAGRMAGWKAGLTIAAGAASMLFSMPLDNGMATHSGGHATCPMRLPDGLFDRLPASELRWTLLAFTALLAVWAGGAIYRSAWKALTHGETNMNTLVALGTLVAFLYSAYATVWPAPGEQVYFDSVLMILGFLLLGKWLEARARHHALESVDALASLQPATARVRRGGVETMVALDAVQPGDVVAILPGERVPVDGAILSGRTTVDESMLTGEAVPLERSVGQRVLAGSLNYDGAITARVESSGGQTTLAQIARLVEQAQSSRAPMERLADRASAVFVPVVLALAALTLAGWLLIAHSWTLAIAATVAVLVIACPCAMGLAVPAALTVAIGRGAQLGVLIKGGEALERLAGLDAIAMDKTGTLTAGKPSLVGSGALHGFAEGDLLRMAASAEDRSAHPLAAAIVDRARDLGLSWPEAEEVQAIPGRGLTATVEGRACLLGNPDLMREWSIPFPADAEPQAAEAGVTRLWMAVAGPDGTYALAGCFDAKDTLRPTAKATVAWLKRRGIAVRMLTGDAPGAAAPIAAAAGIEDVAAGLLPADKVSRIRDLQRGGRRVGMVGDGVNDAAAMAQADAGFAMGAGAAIAQEAGDVLLLGGDPAGACTAIALARAAVRAMRQNLAWAAAYNVVGIPLAAGLLYPLFHVLLTPWMAAAAMAFSSVSVLLNSLRLRAFAAPRMDAEMP